MQEECTGFGYTLLFRFRGEDMLIQDITDAELVLVGIGSEMQVKLQTLKDMPGFEEKLSVLEGEQDREWLIPFLIRYGVIFMFSHPLSYNCVYSKFDHTRLFYPYRKLQNYFFATFATLAPE